MGLCTCNAFLEMEQRYHITQKARSHYIDDNMTLYPKRLEVLKL